MNDRSWRALTAGGVLGALGVVLFLSGASGAGVVGPGLGTLGLVALGALGFAVSALGVPAAAFAAPVRDAAVATFGPTSGAVSGWVQSLVGAVLISVAGYLLATVWARREVATGPSLTGTSPLHPRIADHVDFNFFACGLYALGIIVSELVLLGVYLTLVGTGQTGGAEAKSGFAPVEAFVLALFLASIVAAVSGGVAAANRRGLGVPELTVALLYGGTAIPLVLTLMHSIPWLMMKLGFRLREVVYLASFIGESRAPLAYWLVYVVLVLALFIGANAGFITTSSGKFSLNASYELFIARRHVAAFRPRLLLGVFAVLMLGIIPPLLVWAMVIAAEAQVERTRIKLLGRIDPLQAAEALHRQKARAQKPTEMMTALSVGGTGLGVMSLVIVLSVMSGFEADLQDKILGTHAHGVITKYAESMADYEEVMAKVKAVPEVTGVTPFILNEVMISSEGNMSGAVIKGIDPASVGTVTELEKYMLNGVGLTGLTDPKTLVKKHVGEPGSPGFDGRAAEPGKAPEKKDPLIELDEGDGQETVLPGIVLGREMASSLKVTVGDRINVVSPVGQELGPQGPVPKSRAFRVAGIFYSGMFEYDSKFIYILLGEAQKFFGVKGAHGLELKVRDFDDARRVLKVIHERLDGYPYRTRDWGEMNKTLFAALRLEKLVMAIILSIIVIVAAGLIVATVIMLVLEKRKEIATLKALGVPDGGVVKIFLAEGLEIGIAGGLLGLFAGLAWCSFIEKVGIKLDPQVYYIPALPVRVEWFQTTLCVLIAVLVTFLASVYPALKAAAVEPVEGLKAE